MATHSTFMDIEAYRQPVDPRRSGDGGCSGRQKTGFCILRQFSSFSWSGGMQENTFFLWKIAARERCALVKRSDGQSNLKFIYDGIHLFN